jgi:enoyl-CoA hydratase/carnithine racemase
MGAPDGVPAASPSRGGDANLDAQPDGDSVLVSRDRGVVTVTLNRPQTLNAVTSEMERRYVEAMRDADADPTARVIVVTGAGRGFCSGADLSRLANTDALTSHVADRDARAGDAAVQSVLPAAAMAVRKPVVAAVNGPVAGMGFALMMSCDVRFLALDARVGTTFARLGLVAEYGLSWLLPRSIGRGHALELLMSGRIVGSDEALRIGLVQEVVVGEPVLDRALAWAHDVADNCSPRSLAQIKRQFYDDDTATFDEALSRSLAAMQVSFGWEDLPEALAARREKRAPSFKGLE